MPETDAHFRCINGCGNRVPNPEEACLDCRMQEALSVVTAARILDALGYDNVASMTHPEIYSAEVKLVADILKETYE